MKIEQITEGEKTRLKMVGAIDEDAFFPRMTAGKGQQLILDLNNVTLINSCGIREWIKWITPISTLANITLESCPKSIVDQINSVDGFLPKSAKVLSFYVPYYCESCGASSTVHFETEKVFSKGKLVVSSEIQCPKCNQAKAEIDVMPKKYFNFLGEQK